jgi:hypothetical protein
MNTCEADDGASPGATAYQLVYSPTRGGRGYAFPCDQAGAVELNLLSARDRNHYLLARALVGRDFNAPVVMPGSPASA